MLGKIRSIPSLLKLRGQFEYSFATTTDFKDGVIRWRDIEQPKPARAWFIPSLLAAAVIMALVLGGWQMLRSFQGLLINIESSGITSAAGDGASPNAVSRAITTSNQDKNDQMYPGQWYLKVPAANINNPVDLVGLDDDNSIGAPVSIYRAGLFNGNARPGEQGTVVLDGHLSGINNEDGVFRHIGQLNTGDEIEIGDHSGNRWRYEVEQTAIYPVSKVPLANILDNSVNGRLVMITCGGAFNAEANTFADRTVVYARLVN